MRIAQFSILDLTQCSASALDKLSRSAVRYGFFCTSSDNRYTMADLVFSLSLEKKGCSMRITVLKEDLAFNIGFVVL